MSTCASPSVRRRWELGGLLLVAVTYIISLFLPVVQVLRGSEPWYGGEIVLGLFRGLVEERAQVQDGDPLFFFLAFCMNWLPNLLLWAGIVLGLRGRWRFAAVAGCVAMVAASIWMIDIDNWKLQFPFLAGYYCWIASMWLMAAVASAATLACGSPLNEFQSPRG